MSEEVPGQVVMQLRRHARWLIDMTADELASMGPTLAVVAKAIATELDPERIYFSGFAESVPHVHVMLTPRSGAVAPEHRGAALLMKSVAKQYSDPIEVAEVASRIKANLQS